MKVFNVQMMSFFVSENLAFLFKRDPVRHENGKQGKRCGSCELFQVPRCDISKWTVLQWKWRVRGSGYLICC